MCKFNDNEWVIYATHIMIITEHLIQMKYAFNDNTSHLNLQKHKSRFMTRQVTFITFQIIGSLPEGATRIVCTLLRTLTQFMHR